MVMILLQLGLLIPKTKIVKSSGINLLKIVKFGESIELMKSLNLNFKKSNARHLKVKVYKISRNDDYALQYFSDLCKVFDFVMFFRHLYTREIEKKTEHLIQIVGDVYRRMYSQIGGFANYFDIFFRNHTNSLVNNIKISKETYFVIPSSL